MDFKTLTQKLILQENTPKEQREYILKQFTRLHKRSIDKMDKELNEVNLIKTARESNSILNIELKDSIICKMAIANDGVYDYYGDGKIFLTFSVPVITEFVYNLENPDNSTEKTKVLKSKGRLISAQIDGRSVTYDMKEEKKLLDIFVGYKSNKSKLREFYLNKKKLNLDAILEQPKIKKELEIMTKSVAKSFVNKDINHIAKKRKVDTSQIAYLNDYTYIIFPKKGVNTDRVEEILRNYDFETWAIDSFEQQRKKDTYNEYLLDEIKKLGSNGVLYYRNRGKDFTKSL